MTNQAPKGIPENIKVYLLCVSKVVIGLCSQTNTDDHVNDEVHESKEANDDDKEGRDISYICIYPVLLTSNYCPCMQEKLN